MLPNLSKSVSPPLKSGWLEAVRQSWAREEARRELDAFTRWLVIATHAHHGETLLLQIDKRGPKEYRTVSPVYVARLGAQ